MKEIDIQSQIRIALSEYGIVIRQQCGIFYTKYGQAVKIGIPGISDLLFLGNNGKIAWIEVKRYKGKHRQDQENFIAKMHEMGYIAGFCESVEDALKLIGAK